SLVEKKAFRSDLYYMLSSFNITLPPLRERPEDIMVLSKKYAEQYSPSKKAVSFDKESSEALINYPWQGNMRQLESVIESAVNVTGKSVIRLSNLPLDIINDYYSAKHKTVFMEKITEDDEKFFHSEIKEYNRILLAIKKAGGNVKEAAKMLKVPLSTLYRKLTKYKIDAKDYRSQI
ncbi:MAG: sigma-54-dependent Fis family transcriptional regulator, partial [Deltaproteobacteria bacterium]|nr:sigma-54-dependent Fis family transcriptional regulator [Deltaproteobacteria bacterium]